MPSPAEPIALSGIVAAAASALLTLMCYACRRCWPRSQTRKPLHLQEVVPIEETSFQEQTVPLPSIGSSIYNSLVTALCYAVAVGTAATSALEDGSVSVAVERSAAFLVLGACTEAEVWQGIRDGDNHLRRRLWRARALLRCAAAAALSVAWLWPLWPQLSGGATPPIAPLALGVASGVVAVGFALSACVGASASVENAAPPPPLRRSLLLSKLLFGFWWREVRKIVAVDKVEGGAPLAVTQLPQLDARQLAAECWRLGAAERARRERAVRAAAASGLAPPEASRARSLLPELWSVVRSDVQISCAWASFCLVAQYFAPLGMLLLISYVSSYGGGAVAPRAFGFGALVALGPLCGAVSDAHTFANGWTMGTRLRGYLSHAISDKALRLDASATEQSVGQIVNLLAVDANNIINFSPGSARRHGPDRNGPSWRCHGYSWPPRSRSRLDGVARLEAAPCTREERRGLSGPAEGEGGPCGFVSQRGQRGHPTVGLRAGRRRLAPLPPAVDHVHTGVGAARGDAARGDARGTLLHPRWRRRRRAVRVRVQLPSQPCRDAPRQGAAGPTQHRQSGRLGGPAAGHRGLIGRHLKA